MIIELTREDTNRPITINLDNMISMETGWANYFNPMRDAMDAYEITLIHFEHGTIRVKEKYEGIYNRLVENGVNLVSEVKS